MAQIDKITAQLHGQLDNLQDNERHEWLRTLHTNYSQRFLADNERIWSTGAIMIPLSLGGFVAFTSIDNPTRSHTFVIGMASSLLMLAWIAIAENHRAFQDKSLAWIHAIERKVGLEENFGAKVEGNWFTKIFAFRGGVQFIRIALLILVLGGWGSILIFWPYS